MSATSFDERPDTRSGLDSSKESNKLVNINKVEVGKLEDKEKVIQAGASFQVFG